MSVLCVAAQGWADGQFVCYYRLANELSVGHNQGNDDSSYSFFKERRLKTIHLLNCFSSRYRDSVNRTASTKGGKNIQEDG